MVIRVLLDTASRYEVVAISAKWLFYCLKAEFVTHIHMQAHQYIHTHTHKVKKGCGGFDKVFANCRIYRYTICV